VHEAKTKRAEIDVDNRRAEVCVLRKTNSPHSLLSPLWPPSKPEVASSRSHIRCKQIHNMHAW
jgi:hypothetical protein